MRNGRRIKKEHVVKLSFMDVWSPDIHNWINNPKIRAVVFLDQCVQIKKSLLGLSADIKILCTPIMFKRYSDRELLRSVLKFVERHSLDCKNIKIGFITVDEKFFKSANANTLFSEYGFEIEIITICLSEVFLKRIESEIFPVP